MLGHGQYDLPKQLSKLQTNKSARHGRHAGRITGGTECYGRHYSCDDPL